MKRTPIAHVIFPRASTTRPLPELAHLAARGLAEVRGLDLELILPVPIKPLRRVQSISRQIRHAPPWPPELDAALRALDPKPTLIPYVPIPFRSIESAATAIAAALIARRRARRPAVIQGSFLDEGGFTAAFVGEALGVASIAVAHGTDVRVAKSAADSGRRRRARSALEHATAVVAVAHVLAQDLAVLGREARVIRFTASPDRFKAAPREGDKKRVLFVGRLSRAKGLDLLLEAFAGLEDKDALLTLIGPKAHDLDPLREATRLGVAERVQILDELPQDSLPPHYAQSTCLALPSRAEGFPSVIVESLLTGRPVVASDVGGVREIVDDSTGSLIPPDEPEALRIALESVLERSERGDFDPDALRRKALPFAAGQSIQDLEALTFELIEGGPDAALRSHAAAP